jgi:hypothetical protein
VEGNILWLKCEDDAEVNVTKTEPVKDTVICGWCGKETEDYYGIVKYIEGKPVGQTRFMCLYCSGYGKHAL